MKWFIGSVAVLAVIVGLLGSFFGGRKVVEAYWLVKFGNKKISVDIFSSKKVGFLIDVSENSVYLWVGGRLRRLKLASEAEYLVMRGCTSEPPQEVDVKRDVYANLSAWEESVRPGDVVVFHEEAEKNITRLIAVDYWLFIDAPIKEQCELAK